VREVMFAYLEVAKEASLSVVIDAAFKRARLGRDAFDRFNVFHR